MTRAYYSTVFEQSAPRVWEIVRDFNNYPVWVGGVGESWIEDDKTGDTVGAVRSVLYQERNIRCPIPSGRKLTNSAALPHCR